MQSYLRGSMLTAAQRDVLNGFIGNEGIYFETIRDYDGVAWGTKTLYLERAISQNCQDFLQSLDKLYQPALVGNAKTSHLDFIRALKAMNDLCFNNPVKFGDYGTRDALRHYFGGLETVTPAIAVDFKTAIQSIVNPKLVALREEHPEVNLQRQARMAAEANIVGQTGWRNELDLPAAQLPFPVQAIHAAGNPNIFFNNPAPTHQQAQHQIPVAIQQAITQAGFDEYQLPHITKPACIHALQTGLFTVQQLQGLDGAQLNCITTTACIDALQAGEVAFNQLAAMSISELRNAVNTGNYPGHGMAYN